MSKHFSISQKHTPQTSPSSMLSYISSTTRWRHVTKSYASFFIDFFKGCNTFFTTWMDKLSQHCWQISIKYANNMNGQTFTTLLTKSLSNMQIYKFTSSHPPPTSNVKSNEWCEKGCWRTYLKQTEKYVNHHIYLSPSIRESFKGHVWNWITKYHTKLQNHCM